MTEEITALKSELALLKLQFSERVNAVESRLNTLLEQENIQSNEQNHHLTDLEENTANQSSNQAQNKEKYRPKTANEYLAVQKQAHVSIPTKPSFFILIFQTILTSLFDWFSPVIDIYQSYKTRGMLGIFTLTIVGIGLTLAGFGYLMQLLIDQLAAGSKSLLMSLVAAVVIVLGISLKIKTRFTEFASAIVTLGILLAYSTVYFSGSVYGILPDIVVLLLYLLIALTCHGLGVWLDTKVIAGLGIIGIATMPILSNTMHFEPFYYLLSLAFVVASSLLLAYRKDQPWLGNLSLAFTIVALEWIIGIEAVAVSAWLVNVFYLLFFSYVVISLFNKANVELHSHKKTLLFASTLIGSTVLFFFQANNLFSAQMSLCFALNTLIAVAVSIVFYRVQHKLTHFLVLITTLWAVLAVISTVSNAYWGIAWAVEGLLLLFLGRRYIMSSVVNQGQVLSALALFYCYSALAPYFPLPALKSADGWLLSMVIVALIGLWQRILNNSVAFNHFTQKKIKASLQLLEVIWLSVLLIACANIWIEQWTGASVILLQLVLLFRAKYCKQVSIEIFAALLILVPLFYIYHGALMVNSYRFTELPLFAKLSVISTFSQLWLWSAFYRKYQPNSAVKNIAESLRVLFYLLLPVCWLGSVIRRFDENALLVLWLSPLIALLLAQTIKHRLLNLESKILTGLASLYLINVIGELTLTHSILALFGFTLFYLIAYALNRKSPNVIYQFICSWGIFSLGTSIPMMLGFLTSNLFYGLLVASIYWSLAFNRLSLSEHLKRNELLITLASLILVVLGWVLTFYEPRYAGLAIIFILAATYNKETLFKASRLAVLLKSNTDLFLHSIMAITYVTLFAALSEFRLDLLIAPLLAVHGALLLFLKDRRITTVKYSFVLIILGIAKLAMIDAASALLWQKVVLFMGIGLFILAATFWYQKLVNNTAVDNA